jgi:Terminase RNaseH-like domain
LKEAWAKADYARLKKSASTGDGFAASFLYALDGDPRDAAIAQQWLLMSMLNRMQSGRFKVFAHLNDWWEEFRLYHRKDGRVVKEGDDLMSATLYAVMMPKWARTTAKTQKACFEIIFFNDPGQNLPLSH